MLSQYIRWNTFQISQQLHELQSKYPIVALKETQTQKHSTKSGPEIGEKLALKLKTHTDYLFTDNVIYTQKGSTGTIN